MLENYKNKKIAVIGYGKEGKSTIDFLIKNNIDIENIYLLDGKNDLILEEKHNGINTVFGNKYLDNLDFFDIIIKSPGTSYYNEKIFAVKEKLSSGMQIFFENYKGKVICITGTKGKSTTSSLVYEILKKAGFNTIFLGNIGNPVLSSLDFSANYDFVVLEMSSYMLEGLKKENFISVLGNIYPDHLDWHKNFENYSNAKINILNGSEINLVFDETDDKFQLEKKYKNIKTFGKNGYYKFVKNNFYINNKIIFDDREIKLIGEHNRYNILVSLRICDIVGIDFLLLKELIKEFNPLPHRMEFIGTFKGIEFYDDAISTTPESTIASLNTFKEKIGTIFLGGLDRGYEFQSLIKKLEEFNIKNIVLFPDSGKKIKQLLDKTYNFIETSDMEEAVDFAYKYTETGKICLLSCASPSYSIWKNFEEKGDLFKKIVQSYK
ncbi:MAG: UDP-N-acetylmuramoyl-L-alanine--D-glutamate ligase [Candidatus Gracilibacteria bacterium]|nr:UDP-N-acetylmuramoyl-L-alanine--D-glutamate ligase [Candidatus Gracilibacteria bacterium]